MAAPLVPLLIGAVGYLILSGNARGASSAKDLPATASDSGGDPRPRSTTHKLRKRRVKRRRPAAKAANLGDNRTPATTPVAEPVEATPDADTVETDTGETTE